MAKRSGILCGSRRFGVMLRRSFLMVGILAVLCTLGTLCPAMSIVYSEDGEYLAHWRPDREKVSVWNLESGKCSQFDFEKLTAPYRPEWKVCVDGKLVTFDLRKEVCGTIKFWETGWSPDGRYYVLPNSRQIQDRNLEERNSFSAVSWSPDGRFLLVGTFGGNSETSESRGCGVPASFLGSGNAEGSPCPDDRPRLHASRNGKAAS